MRSNVATPSNSTPVCERPTFKHRESLDDFDFTFNPRVPKAKIIDLATCSFIRKHENVWIVGQTGVAKSHIAQAVGHRACLEGFNVLYTPAYKMLKDLRACRADGTHERRLARYSSVDLLLIDDLCLRALTHDEPIELYDIIRQRYERLGSCSEPRRDRRVRCPEPKLGSGQAARGRGGSQDEIGLVRPGPVEPGPTSARIRNTRWTAAHMAGPGRSSRRRKKKTRFTIRRATRAPKKCWRLT